MSDIYVIGAGASGMVAAICAATQGQSVTVIEKRDVPGKKILATGNGRCNYTNTDQDIRHYHSQNMDFVKKVLDRISYDELMAFFESLGVLAREKNGYIYPYSNQAASIQKALWERARELGVSFKLKETVTGIKKYKDSYVIETDSHSYKADKIIITTGTGAGIKGNDDAGLKIINSLSLKCLDYRPALTYIKSDAYICRYWAGVRAFGSISIYDNGQKILTENGELMLTGEGISGIAAFQLSFLIAQKKYNELSIDFLPDLDSEQIVSFLKNTKAYNKAAGKLYGLMQVKLADSLFIEYCKKSPKFKQRIISQINFDELSDEDLYNLADFIKNYRIKTNGTGSISESQVLSGGVCLTELDDKLCLKRYPEIYLAGELLDVNGDCGGYNLTWAWKSGMIAGNSAGGNDD